VTSTNQAANRYVIFSIPVLVFLSCDQTVVLSVCKHQC